MQGKKVPNVSFKTRVRDKKLKNKKKILTSGKLSRSNHLFKNKKCVVFSLPGAFTLTCSNHQLPDYDKYYKKLKKKV